MSKAGQVMIDQQQILRRAAELGQQITSDFAGEPVLLVGILRGAVVWMADIMKAIDLDVSIDFMEVSSYGASTETSGRIEIRKDIQDDIEGKNLIIIEDIVDSGRTLEFLKQHLEAKKAKKVKICTLLDKPERRQVEIRVDYVGFTVEDKFIVGYGLDFDQKYRNLPYITFLEE